MQRCEQCGQVNDNYEERCVYCGAYLYISIDHTDDEYRYNDDSIDLTDEIINELTHENTEPLDYNDASENRFDQVVEENLYHEENDNFIIPEPDDQIDEYPIERQNKQPAKTKKRHILELEYELKKKIKRNKKLEESFAVEFKDINIDMTSLTLPLDITGLYRLSPRRGFTQIRLSVICYDILKNKIERNQIILKASTSNNWRNFKISINPNIHKTAMIILMPEEIEENINIQEEDISIEKNNITEDIPKNNIFLEQMRGIEHKIGMKISNTAIIIKARDRFEIVGEIYLKSPDKYETIMITATCYDKNNNILATESTKINTKLYLGFDTLRLIVNEVDVSKVEHVKLYPTLQG